MSCSDPIADMLTIIRNGVISGKKRVAFNHSKMKEGVCQVLQDEGYISRFEVLDTRPARRVQVHLKWDESGENPIHEIRRVSKPGCRVYQKQKALKPVINGFGISVVSTSRGILSDRACRAANVGGEVLAVVR
ncbi:MAG: 30S ribosomal protein S8 [Planctomycetota bacterium]